MVKVRLFGAFAHISGVSEFDIEIREPKPVAELLRNLIPRYDEFHDKIILVNGRPSSEEVLVTNEDEIKVLPVLSGG